MMNYLPRCNKPSEAAGARALGYLLLALLPTPSSSGQPESDSLPTQAPALLLPSSLPRPESPIAYFRQLLSLDASTRAAALLEIPPEKREYLKAKLREYSALPPQEREARLQITELRYFLVPLMKHPPAGRSELLRAVPEQHRPLIEERLAQWDRVPAAVQKEVLENERTMHYFLRLEKSNTAQREDILNQLPEDHRRSLEENLEQWNALPPEKRQRMYEHFQQFFEMPPGQKEKTLNTLSEEERQRVEKAIASFGNLTPEQRQRCLDSFRKITNLSEEDRERFFVNAQRWQEMSPRERETWRNLVRALPPAPPGLVPSPLSPAASTQKAPVGVSGTPPPLPGYAR